MSSFFSLIAIISIIVSSFTLSSDKPAIHEKDLSNDVSVTAEDVSGIPGKVSSVRELISAEDDDGNVTVYVSYESIVLEDEYIAEFPKLSKVVKEFNEETKLHFTQRFYDLSEYRESDGFSATYSDDMEIEYVRADDKIFSFRYTTYSYSGGAHGYDSVECRNINPATGEDIELPDVLVSMEDLAKKVDEALVDCYGEDYNYFHDVYDIISKYTDDEWIWSISEDALYIHFPTYEIASGADGQITAVLEFEDFPGLVKDEYVG